MMRESVRRHCVGVDVGGVMIGGGHPIVVQSMTNTDTADIEATVDQVFALWQAGSELVRVTVDRADSAAAVAPIRDRLMARGADIPIVGDFHYNGHRLLQDYPCCAAALAKYRINPGNVGFGEKRDRNFAAMIDVALNYDKPVRIGVNWGSLDQDLLTRMMDENAGAASPLSATHILHAAMVKSALLSAQKAESQGLASDKIILSVKVSFVPDLLRVYRLLAEQCDYALHLGLTEAGMGSKGIVSSTSGLAILLHEGIGDTVRISLTPDPGGDRALEVRVGQEILQSLGLRSFAPEVISCPGCGRTTSTVFQELAQEIQSYVHERLPFWRENYSGFEDLKLAVMGCIVNGPGESKHADIGISLPGTGELPVAPVYVDGKKVKTLRGNDIGAQFKNVVEDYVSTRYSAKAPASHRIRG